MGSQSARWAIVCGALLAAATLSADQRQLRERSVVVSAMAGDTPVTDLKAGEFTVVEDGVSREVLRVAPAPPPSHLLLLVDDSHGVQRVLQDLRTALTGFVKTMGAVSPAPQMSFMTFGERPTRRVDYTPKAAQVEREAGRIFAMTGGGSYFLDAIVEGSRALRKQSPVHPVLVAFVDEGGPEFSNTVATQVADALRAAGASLWTVALEQGPQPVLDLPGRERATVLGDTTTASGGMNIAILSGQGLTSAFTRTAAALNARYLVTYGRPDSLIPPERLEVGSTRRDVRVRAPRWPGAE